MLLPAQLLYLRLASARRMAGSSFPTDMAHEKVDAKLLGFKINDAQTNKTGDAETFTLSAPWTIAENDRLPINYDAVVSAVSQPVTEQDVLSVVFVLEWKGE